MELDFDKEIDALLRKAQRDGPVLVGDLAASHLDADEIAAFAENALPERSRGAYTMHLADCDRCRKILSNLLVMNAGTAPAAGSPGAITIAERDLPWYRKLFLFPNLAYVMGGLVLVFGGFLAFTVVQQSSLDETAGVLQATEPEVTRGGPNFESDVPAPEAMVTNSANSAGNVATGSMPLPSNMNASARPAEVGVAGPKTSDNNVALDGISTTDSVAAAPPPPAAAMQPVAKDRDDATVKEKSESKVAAAATSPSESAKNDAMNMKGRSLGNVQTQSGPMRNNEQNYQRQLENLDRGAQASEKRKTAARDEEGSRRRAVGGRTFERKEGVWYDVNYQGRPTINVRRGTDEFNRLDGGLRSIANSLSGTIVVVWGAKAYRIQ